MLIDITGRKATEIEVDKERRFLFSAIDLLPISILFLDNEQCANGIIDLHHGRIWACSAGSEQGSTFAITLPFRPSAE